MLEKQVRDSFYIKKIKENSGLIIWSLLIAVFFLLISYPGILYSDSYGRVDTADKLRNSINLLLAGRRNEMPLIECWITLVPSIFIAASKMLTGNIAAYTFAQCFSFFFISFLLIKRLGASWRWLQYILLLINPLFYGIAVYYEAGVGCITAITVMALILSTDPSEKNVFDTVIEIVLLAFASFVAFGYRANAFTVIPVIVIYILVQKWEVIRKIWVTLAIVLGLLMVAFVPKVLNVDTMGSGVASFVWDMLTAINRMEPEKQEEYIDYLDELAGEGATASALKINSEFSVLGFMPSKIDAYVMSADGATGIILKKYVNFIVKEPAAYFDTKWMYAKKTLGIEYEILAGEYEYNLIERMWEWGINDTMERLLFYRKYYAVADFLDWLILHPWKVFVLSAVLVAYKWLRKKKNREFCLFLFGLAVFYYGAFLINAQSFELRYFYPSLYLMWIMDIGILLDLILNLGRFIKKRLDKRTC